MKPIDFTVAISDRSPEIILRKKGELIIKGRSIPEDSFMFYTPLIDEVKALECDTMSMDFQLEYINSSSSLLIFKLLEAMEANKNIKSIHMNWYYEYDDDDILELGEIYDEKLKRIKFEFKGCVEIFD